MKELLYKELSMQKGIMKKNIQSLVILIFLNAIYIYTKNPNISFIMGIYGVLFMVMNTVINSITIEKSNKMYEKMLTMFRVEKIIGSKLIVAMGIGAIVGFVFSLGNRLLSVVLYNQKFDVQMQILEIVVITLLSLVLSFLFGTVYLLIDNVTLCGWIITPVTYGTIILCMVIGEIKTWQFIVAGIVCIVVSAILYKLLGLVKPDRLTKE